LSNIDVSEGGLNLDDGGQISRENFGSKNHRVNDGLETENEIFEEQFTSKLLGTVSFDNIIRDIKSGFH